MLKKSQNYSSSIFRSVGKFLLLNFLIVFVLTVAYCPSCFTSIEAFLSIFHVFVFSFFMSSFLSFGGYYVDDYYEQRISWIENPIKRLLLTAITYLIYTFVISYILFTINVFLTNEGITWDRMPWWRIALQTRQTIAIAFFIAAVFITRSWLLEWRKAAIEREQLKNQRLASRYQSLKDQLNPHFLFNSLNALSNLVYEDADKSAHFIQQLSKIYRYVLDVQQEELVSLDKELEFARSYLTLQKIRFEDSLQYDINVNGTQGFMLPPLSLQLLLENAVKHNIASMAKPLNIYIKQKDDLLMIINDFQPKSGLSEESAGVGLDNIMKRYELLSARKPEIIQDNQQFIVSLPLLTLSK